MAFWATEVKRVNYRTYVRLLPYPYSSSYSASSSLLPLPRGCARITFETRRRCFSFYYIQNPTSNKQSGHQNATAIPVHRLYPPPAKAPCAPYASLHPSLRWAANGGVTISCPASTCRASRQGRERDEMRTPPARHRTAAHMHKNLVFLNTVTRQTGQVPGGSGPPREASTRFHDTQGQWPGETA